MWFQELKSELFLREMGGLGHSFDPTQTLPAIPGDRTHKNNHTALPSHIHTRIMKYTQAHTIMLSFQTHIFSLLHTWPQTLTVMPALIHVCTGTYVRNALIHTVAHGVVHNHTLSHTLVCSHLCIDSWSHTSICSHTLYVLIGTNTYAHPHITNGEQSVLLWLVPSINGTKLALSH